jgi:hypothetical protein
MGVIVLEAENLILGGSSCLVSGEGFLARHNMADGNTMMASTTDCG